MGLPVARITNKIHEMTSRWAAGLSITTPRFLTQRSEKVYRVYIDRITGNCSHQHGTTRMGGDLNISAEQVVSGAQIDNLFVVDVTFLTATGANPSR